jgi:Type IV secretion-system coupling protein DNA-binding domain
MIDKTLNLAQQLGDHIAQQWWITWFGSAPSDYIYIQLKPLKDIEQALALWQWLLRNFVSVKQHIDLIVSGNRQSIMLIIGVPAWLQQYVENIYFANFATSDLQVIKYTPPTSKTYLNFGDEEIAMDADFIKNGQYMDPFKDVMSVYDMVWPDESMDLVYRCRFKKSSSILGKAWKVVKKIARDSSTWDSPLTKGGGVAGGIWNPEDNANQQVEMKLCYSYLTNNAINQDKLAGTIKSVYLKYLKWWSIKLKSSVDYRSMWLNQFVNFYHFMSKEFVVPNLEYATYRKLPAPTNVPSFDNTSDKNDLTILWYTDYKSDSKIFGIRREDKLRHMYVIGQTGTGKSKFIANMVRSDMISNKWVCVIDPHGDLIDDILSQVPSYRTNDVVLFDVADREFPVWFNVFEYEKPEEKPLIASGIVGIFKKMFGTSWWPRLEYILRNVILSLLEYPGATFLDLIRMLTDDNYREEILAYVKDPILMKFWRDEFDKFQPKQREEAIAPIANKVGQFTSSTIVRNIFGQSKTKMNFRKMMDEGKIILINLSKGKVGEDNMAMIGSFIASKIQIDAMSRADIDESQRRDFYLYIDEFQNFATESFATILSEARKYKLALIMANQYISQIDELVRNAIFGNVGTIVCNRIGKDDAEIMSQQFKGMASTNDFLSLPNRRCYAKLMINGMVSDPFSMKTADFVKYEDFEAVKAKVRDQSRQRYAMPRLELEALMKAWAEKKFTMAEKVMEKAKAEAKAAKERLVADKSDKAGQIRQEQIIDVVPSVKEEIIISSPVVIARSEVQRNDEAIQWVENESVNKIEKSIENKIEEIIEWDIAPEGSTLGVDRHVVPPRDDEKENKKPREQIPTDYQTSRTPDLSGLTSTDSVIASIKDWDKLGNEAIQWVEDIKETIIETSPRPDLSQEERSSDDDFTVNDLVIGNEYSWYVKLKYNYGLFVTVYGVEWLLHKNFILSPEWVSWKKLYEIGDPIMVKAMEFKEIEWEKRVVWTQI